MLVQEIAHDEEWAAPIPEPAAQPTNPDDPNDLVDCSVIMGGVCIVEVVYGPGPKPTPNPNVVCGSILCSTGPTPTPDPNEECGSILCIVHPD
jgi:hypothetical protein